MQFHELIRNTRLKKKMTLRELARRVGLSPPFISKMEVGDFKPPSEENIIKIANALNLNSDELLAMAGKIPNDVKAVLLQNIKLYNYIRNLDKTI